MVSTGTVYFTVPGNPKGKDRPRSMVIKGKLIVYTGQETREYEKRVRERYLEAAAGRTFEGPVQVCITAYYPIPKRTSREKRNAMESGLIVPSRAPDIDNVIKIILDGLNGVAYKDDVSVISVSASKCYESIEGPMVCVKISDYGSK